MSRKLLNFLALLIVSTPKYVSVNRFNAASNHTILDGMKGMNYLKSMLEHLEDGVLMAARILLKKKE